MMLADLAVVAVILISVISAFRRGFMVELFSLGGLVLGLLIASADYPLLAQWLTRWVKSVEAADLSAFLAIALGVMLAAGLVGKLLRDTIRWAGLGLVDRSLGALFGFFEGCVLVTLTIMAGAAFFPNAPWLKHSRLAAPFLSAAHEGSRITPDALGEKIRSGIQQLRMTQPR